MNKKNHYPVPVLKAMRKLGRDIKDARLRRRIQAKLLAQRAGIAPGTLSKIEKGDSGVGFGSYALVVFSLGMIDRLSDLVDVRHDTRGLEIEEENLPKRIRLKNREGKNG